VLFPEGFAVPYTLQDYFARQGHKVVTSALERVAGKAPSFVTAEAIYRQAVMQPAWEALPLPIRMLLKREHDRWENLLLALRDEVYDLSDDTIALRPDAAQRVLARIHGTFCTPDHAPAASGPPLALPVARTAAAGNVPLAMPVGAPVAARPAPAAQVARPVATGKPAERTDRPVGIDLGTTYSLVAYVDVQGRPCCLPNAAGDLLTPSVVLFEDGGTVVGKEAVLASAAEPDRVAECVKRDMGAKVYRRKVHGQYLPPEVISSLILRSLKADAERRLGEVRRAVITVPAYFEETRRRATMDAGRLAGLEVLDIINEPTAAAIAYGYQLGFLDRSGQLTGDRPLRVLVFDLGGGTFDVTIVAIQGRDFKALATDGDVHLGGKDWDERLMALAAERFHQQFGTDPREDPASLQELALSAEAAKRTLTERKKAALFVNHAGSRLKVEVSREEFEDATAGLLERTRMTAQIVVRQAGLSWEQIDRVLLVGGSTRMPMVPRMLEELTGRTPDRSVSPDEAVAHGAALYAQLRAPLPGQQEAPFTVTDVSAHSLGVQGAQPGTGRKVNKVLIPKNSPLPRSVTKVFRTFRPDQRSVVIKVLEGESDRPEVCTQIGVCAIRDLPPGLPAGWPVLVRYQYESNGRLSVSARVKGHKAVVKTEFERENRMADEDLELWTNYVADELRDATA
jgi:molecular chaperone DnaK